jgi:hypothetical protein
MAVYLITEMKAYREVNLSHMAAVLFIPKALFYVNDHGRTGSSKLRGKEKEISRA